MTISDFTYASMILMLEISLPVLLVATVVGLIISIFQALTQIQEQTLPQVAKIVAVSLLMLMGGAAAGRSFDTFMNGIFAAITQL